MKRLFILALIFFPASGYAQLWSSVLSSGRAISWANAGAGAVHGQLYTRFVASHLERVPGTVVSMAGDLSPYGSER